MVLALLFDEAVMNVVIDGWAWLKKSEMDASQLAWLKRTLTLTQGVSKEYRNRVTPAIMQCYEEDDKGRIGIPREFFFERESKSHNIKFEVSDGDLWPSRSDPVDVDGVPPPWASARGVDASGLTFFDVAKGKPAELIGEQPQALSACIKSLNSRVAMGGIVQAPTGWGKTIFALALIRALKKKTAILVHREFLMNQWIEKIGLFLPDAKVGVIQGKKWEVDDCHIVMIEIQTLASWVKNDKVRSELAAMFGLVVSDECVDGDAMIETDAGPMRMRELVGDYSRRVLSFNEGEKTWEYRNVTCRWNVGVKPTMEISTVEGGLLRVTAEHLVCTEKGWIEAGWLQPGDRILSPAIAGAVQGYRPSMGGADRGTSSLATSRDSGRMSTGLQGPGRYCLEPPSASVGAERGSPSERQRLEGRGSRHIDGHRVGLATIVESRSLEKLTVEQPDYCWERSWGTGTFPTPTTDLGHQEWHSTTAQSNMTGLGTKHLDCQSLDSTSETESTGGMGVDCSIARQRVTRGYEESTALLQSIELRPPQWIGLTKSPTRASRGGISTMGLGVERVEQLHSTQRGLPGSESILSVDGCAASDLSRRTPCGLGSIGPSHLELTTATTSSPGSANSFQNAWHTNVLTVKQVSIGGYRDVFDIEVEGNHNFVANGFLVHNCHRISAPTWMSVIPLFGAAKRLGISARPKRSDGLDRAFFYHIGPKIFTGNQLRLIPKIRRVWTTFKIKHERLNPSLISKEMAVKFMAKDTVYNEMVVAQVALAAKAGRKILVYSHSLEHLRRLKVEIDNADCGRKVTVDFFIGGMTEEDLRVSSRADIILATFQMASDSLDIPALDTVVLATPVRNPEQSAGRILRPFEGKKEPVVVDFRADEVPILKSYGESRDRVYEKLYSQPASLTQTVLPNVVSE